MTDNILYTLANWNLLRGKNPQQIIEQDEGMLTNCWKHRLSGICNKEPVGLIVIGFTLPWWPVKFEPEYPLVLCPVNYVPDTIIDQDLCYGILFTLNIHRLIYLVSYQKSGFNLEAHPSDAVAPWYTPTPIIQYFIMCRKNFQYRYLIWASEIIYIYNDI